MNLFKSMFATLVLVASVSPAFAQSKTTASDSACAALKSDIESSTSRLNEFDNQIRATSEIQVKLYLDGRREELSSHIEKMQNHFENFCKKSDS